jgi:hypothetical protein
MGTYVYGGWTVPDGGGVPNPATAVSNLMDGIAPFLGRFATTGARDTAKANYISYMNAKGLNGANASLGMRAYVIDRAGYCFWRGDKWVWESTHDRVVGDSWAGPQDIKGVAEVNLLAPTNTVATLPGSGLRQLVIFAACNIEPADMANWGGGRAFVTGPGMDTGFNYLQTHIPTSFDAPEQTYRHTVSRTWYPKVQAGLCQWYMKGLVEGRDDTIQFGHMSLDVVDLGPAD